MSSTGRGSARNADDFYATPAWATDAILRRIGPLVDMRILEPSAGDGAIVKRLLAAGADPSRITAIEIDPDRCESTGLLLSYGGAVESPFESWEDAGERFDLVVMNPPFSAAQAHVERAISLLAPGGTCAALLRLAFCTSKKRAPFRASHPFDMMILSSRPSFTGAGTDSADYAWFLFGARHDGSRCGGRFDVIEGV